jgi:hypothetical protein
MNIEQIRNELHEYIDVLDERFLKALLVMSQQYISNEEIKRKAVEPSIVVEEEIIVKPTKREKFLKGYDVISEFEKW